MAKKKLPPMGSKSVDKWLRGGVKAKHLDRGSKESVRGLQLDVRAKRSASWVLRYQLAGRVVHMGLGSAFEFSLSEARERARRERQRLRDKVDPLQVRRAERAAQVAANAKRLTFREAAKGWFDAKRVGWTVKHQTTVSDALDKWAFPIAGNIDVGEFETPHVLKVLQQPVGSSTLWHSHPPTADRLRNNIRLALDWATVSGCREAGKPNPARWTGHLEFVLAAPSDVAPVKNQPSLPFQRVPELMAKLAQGKGVGAMATRFLILTAARMSEATNAKWSEINLDEAIWTVPAERMKARKEWRQPLSPQAIELLRSLPTEQGNEFAFIGNGEAEPISGAAIRAVLRRDGYGDIVAHGFRSSFSTWAHERSSHSNHTIELALAHSVGSEVERAYRRGDMFEKRRKLMNDWARFCTTPPVAVSEHNVVPIGVSR